MSDDMGIANFIAYMNLQATQAVESMRKGTVTLAEIATACEVADTDRIAQIGRQFADADKHKVRAVFFQSILDLYNSTVMDDEEDLPKFISACFDLIRFEWTDNLADQNLSQCRSELLTELQLLICGVGNATPNHATTREGSSS